MPLVRAAADVGASLGVKGLRRTSGSSPLCSASGGRQTNQKRAATS